MALDLQHEGEQAHALLDRLAPAKLGVVRSVLEVMMEEDEPVTDEDRRRFQHNAMLIFVVRNRREAYR